MFDKDLSGTIDGPEIEETLRGLLSMTGIKFDEEDVYNCKMEIIGVCHTDGDCYITKQDFSKNALSSVFIRSIL